MGHILRIGVTGGIGSGKSLVCSTFSRLGVPVLSADKIAKELMSGNATLRKALLTLLGSSTYRSNGELNRQYVASTIFSNPALHGKVNALVHPRVEAEVGKRFVKLEKAGVRLGIVEAALIYEAGFDKHLDYVIVVDAPEADRIRRVVRRDKLTAVDVRKRIRSQQSTQSKLRKADYVVRNNGSIDDLKVSVEFLLSILENIAGTL
ncbi:MAG: dephospho-CoA kinase [Ignavibacteriales bacterium]|nr:dephospho-CoA kinase [Ignavibacteriales bacterium]